MNQVADVVGRRAGERQSAGPEGGVGAIADQIQGLPLAGAGIDATTARGRRRGVRDPDLLDAGRRVALDVHAERDALPVRARDTGDPRDRRSGRQRRNVPWIAHRLAIGGGAEGRIAVVEAEVQG